jgi:ElaB/YqjD/DUF883 family membrane-anchored ribosome-binding protein
MSDSYGPVSTSSPDAPMTNRSAPGTGTTDATDVKDTAVAGAGSVVDTAKQEASSVASEAKSQAKTLYHQGKRELRDQAEKQQQRAADGLRSAGDELRSMASSAQNPGLATDLVRQASHRVSGVADWLSARDPESLLQEVKQYARRRPGMFIGIAAVAGVVVGRLVRALAEESADRKADETQGMRTADYTARPVTTGWTANGSPSEGVGTQYGVPGAAASEFADSPRGDYESTEWTQGSTGEVPGR